MFGGIDGCWECCRIEDRKREWMAVFIPMDAPNVHGGECG